MKAYKKLLLLLSITINSCTINIAQPDNTLKNDNINSKPNSILQTNCPDTNNNSNGNGINISPNINISPEFNPNFEFNPQINIPVTISNTISVTNTLNIIVNDETGTKALKEQLIFYAQNENDIKKVQEKVGGEIIGGDQKLGLVQIQLPEGKDPFKISDELEKEGIKTMPNFISSPHVETNDPFWNDQNDSWGQKEINLSKAWDIAEPANIKLAAIEFGSEEHEDIKFNKSGENVGFESHGNHVSGIINGIADNNTGITGIMKGKANFTLYSVSYDFASIAQGLRKAVDDGNKVINMSLGLTVNGNKSDEILAKMVKKANSILGPSIKYAKEKGVLIVAAAGNGLRDSDNALIKALDSKFDTPASFSNIYDNVITVAAINKNGEKTDFSNFGNNVSVAAPGKDIFSTINNNDFANDDGTSMAAPYVTGVAGLILSKNLNLNYLQIKEAIINSAKRKVDGHNFGILDAEGALKLSETVTGESVKINESEIDNLPIPDNNLPPSNGNTPINEPQNPNLPYELNKPSNSDC